MRVGNLELSYPIGYFNVLINHFTSRKSTAIEWGILELAKEAQENNAFSDIALADVFEHILKISDPDLLIKPCLISLEDLEAIKVNNLSDQISLKELRLSDIRLTDKGERMQAKGLLPGVNNEETLNFIYDLFKNSLIKSNKGNFTSKPIGYQVGEINSIDEVIFPRAEINNYLNSCKSNKTYQWLQETSDISSIELQEAKLKWLNVRKNIEVKDGTIIKLDDTKDNDQTNKFIFNQDISGEYDNRITYEISPLIIEQDVSEMFLLKDLNIIINNELENLSNTNSQNILSSKKRNKNKVSYVFIDSRFVDDSMDLSNFNVVVVYNSYGFNFEIENKRLVINTEQDISDLGCILLNKDSNIFVGKASLYNNFGNGSFSLGYKRNKSKIDEIEVISNIIDENIDINFRIMILGMLRNQEIVLDKLKNHVSKLSSLENKLERINYIKNLCKEIFDKNLDLIKLYKEITYMDLIEGIEFNSFESVRKAYIGYRNHEDLINNFEIEKYIRDIIIDKINYTKTHEDIVKIYKLLFYKEKGKKVEQLKKLYNYSVIRSIYSNFRNKEEDNLEKITSIETNYVNMKKIMNEIELLLPGIDLSTNLHNKTILEYIVENKQKITDIKNSCINWNKYLKVLKDTVDIELLLQNCELSELFENMTKIRDEIAIFTDDESIKYQNVLVLDTCSVLDNSKHIKDLTKKHLVVIPSVVLKELDNQKTSEDETKAYKAREAIRTIEELNKKIKLENSNLDLIPKDLSDEENNTDNMVLSVAIKYIAKKVILITEDINLRNKSASQEIRTMNFNEIHKTVKVNESKDQEKVKDSNKNNNKSQSNGKKKKKKK